MTNLGWTEDDWINVNNQIKSGAASMSYSGARGGKSVSYRPLTELIAMRRKIGMALGKFPANVYQQVDLDG